MTEAERIKALPMGLRDVAWSISKDYERKYYLEGAELGNKLTEILNAMGSDRYVMMGFSDALKRSHRYLQSQAIQTMIHVLCDSANNLTDPRNSYSVHLCKKITEVCEEDRFCINAIEETRDEIR